MVQYHNQRCYGENWGNCPTVLALDHEIHEELMSSERNEAGNVANWRLDSPDNGYHASILSLTQFR